MRRLAALALLAVVAAGCGGSKSSTPPATTAATTTAAAPAAKPQKLAKVAYVTRMRTLGHKLGVMVDGVYPIDSGTPGSQTSKNTIASLQKARVEVESVLGTLRAIVPPKAVRAEHVQLEQGVKGMADEMQQVIVALQKGDIAASMAPASLPALRVVTDATDRMEKKGYDVLNRAAGPPKATAPSN